MAIDHLEHAICSLGESFKTQELTDLQLIEFARNAKNDEKAKNAREQLVRRHARMVWSVCIRGLVTEADASDAFQATFVVLFEKLNSLSWESDIGGWLYVTATNTVKAKNREVAKQRSNEKPYAAAETMFRSAPCELEIQEKRNEEQQRSATIDKEICRLKDRQRRVVSLCILNGKSTDDVAAILGISPNNVSKIKGRVLEILKTRLAKRGVAISVAGLTAFLANQAATASVPPAIVNPTVQAVLTGVFSTKVTALSQGVLHIMFLAQLKKFAITALVALAMVASIAGVAFAWHRSEEPHAAERNADEQTVRPDAVEAQGKLETKKTPPIARFKDPLSKETVGNELTVSAAYDYSKLPDDRVLVLIVAPSKSPGTVYPQGRPLPRNQAGATRIVYLGTAGDLTAPEAFEVILASVPSNVIKGDASLTADEYEKHAKVYAQAKVTRTR